jgi:hypothetical protein
MSDPPNHLDIPPATLTSLPTIPLVLSPGTHSVDPTIVSRSPSSCVSVVSPWSQSTGQRGPPRSSDRQHGDDSLSILNHP